MQERSQKFLQEETIRQKETNNPGISGRNRNPQKLAIFIVFDQNNLFLSLHYFKFYLWRGLYLHTILEKVYFSSNPVAGTFYMVPIEITLK